MTEEHEAKPVESMARIFVQTGKSQMPKLDNWIQVGEEEARVAYEMTLRNELSGGTPVVREFEAHWRDWVGTRYALTTCNGTSALYSALFGLGVGPGDEVICPTYTWICTIAPAPLLGAKVIFCESDPETMMADAADIRRRITSRTKAIVVVHLWGWVCDLDAIMEVSWETGIPVVEDCSHAHGAMYRGKPVGSIGHVGCWSLQGTKPVSAGEGGVIATNEVDVFDRCCLIGQVNRIVGMDLVTDSYQELQPLGTGMKFRAHPVAIGIARVQLEKLPALNARRRQFFEAVEAGLDEIPYLEPIPTSEGSERGGFYGFPIRYLPEFNQGVPLEDFASACCNAGLEANKSPYELLHRLPYFAKGFDLFTGGRGPLIEDYDGYAEGDFSITEAMHRDLLFLPVLSDPVEGAVDYYLRCLKRAGA